MPGWDAASYGEAFADVYDEWYGDVPDVDATVQRVAALVSGGGRVLELGVGTGRLAVPLATAGLEVWGVDASSAMLDRLRANDPAGRVNAVLGDMAGPLPAGPFDVVLVAYNTFFNLVTEQAQRDCLRAVAAVLSEGGSLLVEAFVPALSSDVVRHIEPRVVGDELVLDVSVRDPVTQTVRGQQVHLAAGSVRLRPWRIRYLSPSQCDALAAEAGLALLDRWADWEGSTFGDDAVHHVSRYGRRGDAPRGADPAVRVGPRTAPR
jgi:SAM-dependent methyltransferase